MLYQIAIKEVRRRKILTLYTSIGIALSVSLIVAILTVGSSGQAEVVSTITKYGHSLTILPAISEAKSLRSFGIATGEYIPEEALPEIEKVYDKAITAGWEKIGGLLVNPGGIIGEVGLAKPTFAPRLYIETNVNGIDVIIAGVDPVAEIIARFWWDIEMGGYIKEENDMILGKLFAITTGFRVGDTVTVNGTPLRIVGILKETDSPDDFMIFASLKTVQKIFGMQGKISIVNVRAMCPKCPVGDAAIAISKEVVGVRATAQREIATAQSKIYQDTTSLLLGLVGISLLISCLGTFNLMTSSIHGRIREIGLLKASGASRWQLIQIFLYEALVIGFIGGVIGYILGTALAYVIGPLLFKDIVVKFILRYLPISIALSMFCCVLAGIYPALHASKIKIVEAFKAL